LQKQAPYKPQASSLVDDERRWYRYHHLFADMLRARLRDGGGAEAVAALHRRAGAWFEAQGLVME
jgi:LuxR family transcriptional regulator, maltose regulon positive regulatory protein